MSEKIETVRVKAVNAGHRVKALRTASGTVDVPAEGTIEADILPLTQEQVDDFRLVHKVTISPMKDKKAKPTKPSRVDLEASLVDAKAALDAANAGSDLGAQAAAQKAFDEAEKALAAHKD